jgi:hypothetical protein
MENNKTEKFIQMARKIHGDKFNYSSTQYVSSKEKLTIICKIHGEFQQTPYTHLRKHGCTKCGHVQIGKKGLSTQEFIEKSKMFHYIDNYDYSLVQYVNNNTKVIIICKIHGEFTVMPSYYLTGGGCCSGCNDIRKRYSVDEFIQQSIQNYGEDKYDYSKVKYKGYNDKITIICKIHGEFQQKPSTHLQWCGCVQCCDYNKKENVTTEIFIKRAIEKHGDRYDYSKTNYLSCRIPIIITCKKHGDFSQLSLIHISGAGCSNCSIRRRDTAEEFIEKAKKIHNNIYDYSKVKYVNCRTPVIITCKKHGDFYQIPNRHLCSRGCHTCGKTSLNTTDGFIEKSKRIHDNIYDYSKVKYVNCRTSVNIICKIHGEFSINSFYHLSGYGCAKCNNNKTYSKASILYLDFMSKLKNIHIQHAENDGEYKITTTNFKADGYCKETNTIYEFHGTEYHGDPRLRNAENYSFIGKKYGDLYQKTLEREQQIRDLGYNLVVIWEHDWNKIIKSVKKIQRKFLSNNFKPFIISNVEHAKKYKTTQR